MLMLKNIATTKPLHESEVSELGIQAIEYLCEDLVPKSLQQLEDHVETLVITTVMRTFVSCILVNACACTNMQGL